MSRQSYRMPIPAPVVREAVARPAAVPPSAKRSAMPEPPRETPAPAPASQAVETHATFAEADFVSALHDETGEP